MTDKLPVRTEIYLVDTRFSIGRTFALTSVQSPIANFLTLVGNYRTNTLRKFKPNKKFNVTFKTSLKQF